MRKTYTFMLVLSLLLIFLFVPAKQLYANDRVNVSVEGQSVNFGGDNPLIVDGRTFVPVRGVFEMLGFAVGWDGDTRTATLTSDMHEVIIIIGSDVFTTNGENHSLDVPARIISGRTMLPIRAVLESVGYSVGWNEESSTVTVSSRADVAVTPVQTNLVWLVSPALPHESVQLCNCGLFVDNEWRAIDPITGLLTDQYHNGHGGPAPEFVYDGELSLFGHPGFFHGYHDVIGMHPLNQFSTIVTDAWMLQNSSGLIAVQNVDSSQRNAVESFVEGDDWWSLSESAFTGQFALMYNRVLITDFIFDAGTPWWNRFTYDNAERTTDFIAMSRDGKWGLVNSAGNTLFSFIFDDLIVINENSAFASYNGSYGILNIPATL